MMLLIAFTLISLSAYRYLMFYLCISAPIIARIFVFLKDEKIFAKFSEFLKVKEGVISLAVSVSMLFFIVNALISLAEFKLKENEFFTFPKGASDFLSKVDIKGNMFNEYGFGGYLTWRLYPKKKAFIDTRSLEPPVTFEYRAVASAIENPNVSWKDIIKKYGISYVVTRPLWQNGKIIPIVEVLLDSPDWAIIYADHLSMVFVRRDSGNSSVINTYEVGKEKGMNTIITQASAWAMTPNQVNSNYFITLGKTFFKLGRVIDSEKAFNMAYKRDTDNSEVKLWLKRLEKLKNIEERRETPSTVPRN